MAYYFWLLKNLLLAYQGYEDKKAQIYRFLNQYKSPQILTNVTLENFQSLLHHLESITNPKDKPSVLLSMNGVHF